jgi:hypothetical protein
LAGTRGKAASDPSVSEDEEHAKAFFEHSLPVRQRPEIIPISQTLGEILANR